MTTFASRGPGSAPPRALLALLALLVFSSTATVIVADPPPPAAPAAKSSDLRKEFAAALKKNHVRAIEKVLRKLARAGGRENLALILSVLPKVPPSDDSLYWTLIEGACSFTDAEALEALGKAVVRYGKKALSRDLLYGLSANPSKKVVLALRPVVEKGAADLKLLAVKKIGGIPAKESVDLLIEVLEKEEKYVDEPQKADLLWEAVEALERLTGEKLGPNSVNWKGWWEKNRGGAKLGRGRRDGDRPETGTVVDHLARRRREEFYGLENAPKKGVVVLSATYSKPPLKNYDLNNDHIERVLQRMGVPHVVVSREDFIDFDLKETGAIVINCAQFHRFCVCPTCKPGGDKENRLYKCTGCNKHEIVTPELKPEAIRKLKGFVKRGGYIFGEDWVIKEFLEKAYAKVAGTGEVLRNDKVKTVDVVPGRGMVTHPYLRGIFEADPVDDDAGNDDGDDDDGGDGTTVVRRRREPRRGRGPVEIEHRWTIDDESWAFDIHDPGKVLVLMSSGKLQKVAKGEGAVAFAFRPGSSPSTIGRRGAVRGRRLAGVVMQVLSHFGKQSSTRDEHALQNLLLNFLIDANAAREARVNPLKARRRRR